MIYKGKSQRAVLTFFLLLIFSTAFSPHSIGFLSFAYIPTLFIFILILINFEFQIEEGGLTYLVSFLSMPIYKKVVYTNQIVQMKFSRFGWVRKGVIVKLNKGMNIRITNFTPETIYKDLEVFAVTNDISIVKTNDYKIIDK
ncbi:hypothetical protein ACFVRR_15060 [Gottfriedia sp. NPDC057948]|uniref:hypothetical protein n=1 Tax=Gottfriedia sp. NPDC057948 TaxID=3346287 RepID=UPI0036DEA9BB